MTLASVPKPAICPQCGENWPPRRLEYCPRCGSPAAGCYGYGFDPLRARVFGGPPLVNARAKLVVRSGVFGMGLLCMLTGLSLLYGGWLSPQGLDPVQLWVSRIAGPLLLLQGIAHARLPFRRPAGARVLAFPARPRA
jgi:hypothetical protein